MKKILFFVLVCSCSVQFSNAQINTCVDSSLINPNCICGMIYEPVCGCNGQLYSNPCLAQCDGVTYWTPAVIDSNGNVLPCVSPCNLTIDVETTSLSSQGATDGMIHINVLSGGTPPYYVGNWTFNGIPINVLVPTDSMMGGEGLYCATVIDSDGCDTTICDSIVFNTNSCSLVGASVYVGGATMNASVNGMSMYNYLWSNGDVGSQTIFYPGWCVGITDLTTGCDTLICDTNAVCDASFSFNNISAMQVEFVNTTTFSTPIGPNYSVYYTMSYGDGIFDLIDSSTTHTYTQSGTYIACLEMSLFDSITGNTSCSDIYCDTIFIGNASGNCQASFYSLNDTTGITNPFSFLFFDTSIPQAQILSWNWDFGDGATSTSHFPTHTFSNAGDYIVCLTITANNWGQTCTSITCDTLVITTSQSNGQLTNTDVCMYPNPAKGDVYLSFELENKQELEVELRSLQGERIMYQNVLLGSGQNIFRIPSSQLKSGSYLLQINSRNGKRIFKRLIMH